MEIYNELENDAGNAYSHDATARYEYDEPGGHSMQMVCHIKEKENANRSDLIDMGVFKPTTKNTIKRLKI